MPDTTYNYDQNAQYSGADGGAAGGEKKAEKGLVKIDGSTLPGSLARLNVHGSIVIDTMEIQDRDAGVTQPGGFNPYDVSIQLILSADDGSIYDQSKTIRGMFKEKDGQVKPNVHTITSALTDLNDISEVLISDLDFTESNKNDGMEVWIRLTEYIPLEAQVENQVIQNQASEAAAGVLPGSYDAAASEIAKDTGTP